jgi:hypothetical protein
VAANSNSELWAYLFTQQSVSGQKLDLLCKTTLLKGHTPVVLAGGRLSMRMKSGAIDGWMLESHKPLYEQGSSAKQLQKRWACGWLQCCAVHCSSVLQRVCDRRADVG